MNSQPPLWIPCPCCDEYLCTRHELHVCDCDCPPINELDFDPYSDPYKPHTRNTPMLTRTIENVAPRQPYRSYTNRHSNGSLIRQTDNWPKQLPDGQAISSAYIDRMWTWNWDRYSEMIQMMGGKPSQQMGVDSLVDQSTDETLLAAASHYFEKPIHAVRWVYFYNVSNGFPCERIDIIFDATPTPTNNTAKAD